MNQHPVEAAPADQRSKRNRLRIAGALLAVAAGVIAYQLLHDPTPAVDEQVKQAEHDMLQAMPPNDGPGPDAPPQPVVPPSRRPVRPGG